jgi:hypothetical protein
MTTRLERGDIRPDSVRAVHVDIAAAPLTEARHHRGGGRHRLDPVLRHGSLRVSRVVPPTDSVGGVPGNTCRPSVWAATGICAAVANRRCALFGQLVTLRGNGRLGELDDRHSGWPFTEGRRTGTRQW